MTDRLLLLCSGLPGAAAIVALVIMLDTNHRLESALAGARGLVERLRDTEQEVFEYQTAARRAEDAAWRAAAAAERTAQQRNTLQDTLDEFRRRQQGGADRQ